MDLVGIVCELVCFLFIIIFRGKKKHKRKYPDSNAHLLFFKLHARIKLVFNSVLEIRNGVRNVNKFYLEPFQMNVVINI